MAGHSKWAKVKHFKGAIDVKRGRIFAKLSREATVAAKIGGADPDLNPRLRMVMLKCRAANMPADNVQRAIKKATGEDGGADFVELTYEIFGPGGVAILLDITTDNRNRTAAEIRHVLSRNGGTMATAGSVTRLFQRKGQIIVSRETVGEDSLMELVLEAGAEDFKADENGYEIVTDPGQFEEVHARLEEKGIAMEFAEVTSISTLTVPIPANEVKAVKRLVDTLEENDDVQDVYTNGDFPEETDSDSKDDSE